MMRITFVGETGVWGTSSVTHVNSHRSVGDAAGHAHWQNGILLVILDWTKCFGHHCIRWENNMTNKSTRSGPNMRIGEIHLKTQSYFWVCCRRNCTEAKSNDAEWVVKLHINFVFCVSATQLAPPTALLPSEVFCDSLSCTTCHSHDISTSPKWAGVDVWKKSPDWMSSNWLGV